MTADQKSAFTMEELGGSAFKAFGWVKRHMISNSINKGTKRLPRGFTHFLIAFLYVGIYYIAYHPHMTKLAQTGHSIYIYINVVIIITIFRQSNQGVLSNSLIKSITSLKEHGTRISSPLNDTCIRS